MTLHLLQTSNSYTLMVSDRLVSGGMPDPMANKNLIYYARDAIVAIGYTGKAYGLNSANRNMPTDEWIAEKLFGKRIPRGVDGVTPAMMSYQDISRHLNIGQSIKLLQNELIEAFRALPVSQRKRAKFQLVLAGWRDDRRGSRFVLAQITKSDDTFLIESPRRYLYRSKTAFYFIPLPRGYISDVRFSEIIHRLATIPPTIAPDESEGLLVDEIRRIASLHPDKVGPHCLSILLPPQPAYPIRVRFIPRVEHRVGFRGTLASVFGNSFPVGFSPWIIGPTMIAAPSFMNGSSTLRMGPITIQIEAPAAQPARDHTSRSTKTYTPLDTELMWRADDAIATRI